MRVRLKDIKPNPYRDFAVDPVDDERVEMLTQSIHDHSFWGGIPCRKLLNGDIEAAAGWHRLCGAINAGVTHADLVVNDFTDDQMIKVYALENATQRGNTSLTIAGSVAGALRKCLEEFFIVNFDSEKRGGHNRDGIGRDAVLAKLKDVPGIGSAVVRQQLANLKESGHYARIEREVAAVVEAAHEAELARIAEEEEAAREAEARAAEAERRRQAAEEQRLQAEAERQRRAEEARVAREAREREAAQQREREAEARRVAAEEAARKATAEAEARRKAAEEAAQKARDSGERKPAITAAKDKAATTKEKEPVAPTFDMTGCGRYFKIASHLEAFRILITSDSIAKGNVKLTYERQAEVAAAVIELFNQKKERGDLKHMKPVELTAHLVRDLTLEVLASDRMLAHLLSEAEKRRAQEEIEKSAWINRWNLACADLARQSKSVLTTVQEKLVKLAKERPDGIEMTRGVDFASAQSQLSTAVRLLNQFTTPVTIELEPRRA